MKRMAGLLIGDVAKRTGVPTPTIRCYEEIGLLPAPARPGAGYRHYNASTVEELLFIRKAQALGFSLEENGESLQLSRSGKEPCSHVLTLAHQHLAAVDERIRQLRVFRRQLATDVAKCDKQKTAVTCSGLCQFITDAEPPTEKVTLHLKPSGENRRGGKARR